MKVLTLFAAILVMTCTGYAQSGNGNENGNGAMQFFDLQLPGIVYNPCCDEWIDIVGTAHVVLRKDGSYHLNVKGVTGTASSSGNTYTQRGVSTQNDRYSIPDANPGTVTFNIQLESEDGCSFILTQVYHVTYAADGETPIVNFEKEFVRCLD